MNTSSDKLFTLEAEGEEIDLTDTYEGKDDSFDAATFVSEQDAALAYNDASLSSIGDSEAGTPVAANKMEQDITSRLDELERAMGADAVVLPSASDTVDIGHVHHRSSVNMMGDLAMDDDVDEQGDVDGVDEGKYGKDNDKSVAIKDTTSSETKRSSAEGDVAALSASSQVESNEPDFDAHMARLEQALADSPVAESGRSSTMTSSTSGTDTLSFSALAESQRARGGDDDLTNRLSRLEQLLGPMQSPLTSSRQNTSTFQATTATTTPGGEQGDVAAHLERLDRLLGSSVTPASRLKSVAGTPRFMGMNTASSVASTDTASKQVARGAQVENQMLRERIVELERQLTSRGDVIENMMLSDSRVRGGGGGGDEGVYSELDRVRRSEATAKRALVESESRMQEIRNEMLRSKEKQRGTEAKLKTTLESVEQQLVHSEHRVRARETVIGTLQDRLQAEVRRSQQSRDRDRSVFKKVQGRDMRTGSRSDQKTTEMIHMYESQRREMDMELQQLRRDVRRLNMDLKDRKNGTNGVRRGGRHENDDDEDRAGRLAKKLEEETRDVEDRAALLQRKEEQVVRDVTRMKDEVAVTKKVIEQLEEVNTNLTMELESRPTMRDWKKSQRMIELLQNKLRDAMDGNFDRGVKEEREFEGLQEVAGRDTSNMVRKDRENHRLRLHLLDGMSRSNSIDMLKDICRTLGIGGEGLTFKLQPTVQRIQQVVLAVPRMQGFVRDVCYKLRVDPATTLGVAMELGLEKMQAWETSLKRKVELDRLVQALVMELVTHRSDRLVTDGGTQLSDFDDVRLLAEIKSMVASEKDAAKEEKFYNSIEEEMKINPTEMTARMVTHFQQLFDVHSVKGVMPKMNELFLYSSEMKTFLDAARGRLQLNSHATTAAVMSALSEITETPTGEELNKEGEEKKDGGGKGKKKKMSNLTEEKRTRGGTAFSVTRKGVPGWTVEK